VEGLVTADRFSHIQPVPLRLVVTTAGDGVVQLSVGGEVDIATVDSLGEALTDIMRDPRVRGVVVDFGEVTFIDSTGVAALMAAYRLAEAGRIAFVVTRCRPQASRVLEVMGVDKVLTAGGGHPD
jgi:anti-sigma B factor antagonist